MHEEKGNVKLFTSTDHKGMYRIAFKHQTTNEVYSMQDLKDLRDLITEELGEECEHRGSENGICNGCGKEVYPQPLTEGEGEISYVEKPYTKEEGFCEDCKREYPVWFTDNTLWNEIVGVDGKNEGDIAFLCMDCFALRTEEEKKIIRWELKPQQESKEEECCHGCSTGKSCEKAEEPSKKPSTRISEIRKNITSGGSFKVWYGNDSLTAIVEYLDELHERKVI